MIKSEEQMINILTDLKNNHHVIGIKAEFETEGTRFEEALKLKELALKTGLEFTIKIGGCEAIKDMYDARTIGADTIVAPMIESPYALRKFIQATKRVFVDEERISKKFFINIETKYGFKYLDEILNSDFANDLQGIVMGRTDMTSSLGMDKNDVNNEIIFDYANKIAQKALQHKKEFIIGGGVSILSLPFFRKFSDNYLSKFETRKIVFDAQKALQDKNIEQGILKAINFELMWIKNKHNFYKTISSEDSKRITVLEARCNG